MKHKFLLGLLALIALLLLALPAAAQYNDPDPCFDASLSKSQYAECVGGTGGGNNGSGGATMPPCMSCVTGDDGTGLVRAFCKDSSVYRPEWPQYSDCRAYLYCWPGPYGDLICDTGCKGNACLRI